MKLGRLNHIGVATPSIADSIAFDRNGMLLAYVSPRHYNDLIM
jgi:hypothetical protein